MIIPKQAKFPADPVLERLLAEARRSPNLDIVVEVNLRLRRTYSQLLGDVVKTRDGLVKHRKKLTFQSATRNETNYVAIITGNGYEHIVAFLAIRAMGSTPMPLASSLNADEVGYFLTKARSTHVLVGKDSLKITASILDDLQSRDSTTRVMVIPISTGGMPIDPNNVKIDHSRFMKPDGPGLVLFTSGTTGPPKGAILPRRLFAQVEAAQLGEATFNCRPGHWFGGNRSLLEPVLSGQRVYILPELQGRDRTEAVLGIFRNYRITYAMFTPTLLRDMRDALLMGRQELSKAERDYWHGRFGDLSRIRCATGVVEQSVRQFWTRLSGCPFENNYGSTELGGGALVGLPTMQVS
jgi:malonyl-CoA/methylmalonyl-CoA synthetase